MKISLNGIWHIKDNMQEFDLFGEVPGVVQADLIKLGKMPHPYIGTNEILFKRLEEKDWIYTRDIDIKEIQKDMRYELVFCGIDTLSDVYFNGKFLGCTENMFLEYRFNITDILKMGKNTIKVVISSPINIPRALEKMYGPLSGTHDESSRPYIRKAQYSYGWDWGVRMATSGIWRDVYIEALPDARLYGTTAYLTDSMEDIVLTGYVDRIKDNIDNYEVLVLIDGEERAKSKLSVSHRGIYFETIVKREGLGLWWPRGMGEPLLHQFTFLLMKNGQEVSKEEKEIGLRSAEIVRKDDGEGESFIFYINKKPVFVKGANWIPKDNILSWLTSKDYEKLLEMSHRANMNMLRVWGGGIYEDEIFYKKCDRLGIMVWQDFMFACAEYPDHLTWFRNLATKEVRENVIKLRHHPSIVLWCGNNENNWGFDEWESFTHKVDGRFLGNILYLEDFPKICAEEDPLRPYWPSSPYGGTRPNAEDGGDRHNWSVWSGWEDYMGYTRDRGKFLSEFGFQSAPHPKTINFFANTWEKDLFSSVMVAHNKQIEGPERIMKFIHNHFGIVSDFDAIVYLSQLNQAEAMKTGIEHWRARKYKTAGTIYWQLNDSWPVFSWSAIDYFKRPKALYYYTQRFYRDILPVCLVDDDSLILKIINDRESIVGDLKVYGYDMQKRETIFENTYKNVRVGEDSVLFIDRLSFKMFKKSIIYMEFITDKGIYENDKLIANLRDVTLYDPEITAKMKGDLIIVSSKYPAYGVFIEGDGIEDNFFPLFPGQQRAIKVEKVDEVLSIYDFLRK